MRQTLFAAGTVLALILALSARPTVAADAPAADATKAELVKLAGTWDATAGSRGGMPATEEELKATKIVFAEGTMTLKDGDRDRLAIIKRLDPSKKPAEMDFVPAGKEGKAEAGAPTILAVYKLEGEVLTIAFGRDPAERPKSLDAGETTKVLTLRRQPR